MSTPWERLKSERVRLGHSQSAFAALGGVQKRSQINYEKGERQPDADYLKRIADAGADVGYILTGTPKAVSEAFADIRSTTELAAALGGSKLEIASNQAKLFEGVRAARAASADEEELLSDYRRCAEDDRDVIRRMAKKLAEAGAVMQSPSRMVKPKKTKEAK